MGRSPLGLQATRLFKEPWRQAQLLQLLDQLQSAIVGERKSVSDRLLGRLGRSAS